MDHQTYCRGIAFFFVVSMCFMIGCYGLHSYGQVKMPSGLRGKISIGDLVENWQDYDVYYAGLSVKNPSAIMFDPVRDDRRLVNDKWIAVRNKLELVSLVRWINADINFPPDLMSILGPDNKFYGYIYSAWSHVLIIAIDKKTLWVDDLPLPPIDYSAGGGFGGGL